MAKVTKDLQVTIPKHIADQYGITPGADVEFVPAGDTIRLLPPGRRMSVPTLSVEERLRLFDESRERQRLRERELNIPADAPTERGWQREDLYTRGKPR
jgi:AbrB family looped-hinge helix DNA binding protein